MMITRTKPKKFRENPAAVTFCPPHMNSVGFESGPQGKKEASYCLCCGTARQWKVARIILILKMCINLCEKPLEKRPDSGINQWLGEIGGRGGAIFNRW
jgi:hypothetical protein